MIRACVKPESLLAELAQASNIGDDSNQDFSDKFRLGFKVIQLYAYLPKRLVLSTNFKT